MSTDNPFFERALPERAKERIQFGLQGEFWLIEQKVADSTERKAAVKLSTTTNSVKTFSNSLLFLKNKLKNPYQFCFCGELTGEILRTLLVTLDELGGLNKMGYILHNPEQKKGGDADGLW